MADAELEGNPPPALVPVPEERLRAGLGAWALQDAGLSPLPRGASAEVFVVDDHAGARRVARLAYGWRHEVEVGLRAAEAVAAGGLRAAAPYRTPGRDLVVMVEWPDGVEHPLALLEWVPGEPLDLTTADGATTAGRTLGRVQALLQVAGAGQLDLSTEVDYLAYLRSTHQDLGVHGWLHDRIAGLVGVADEMAAAGELTWVAGVWDGPEIVVDADGALGLLDFGVVQWHPLAHTVAYGTTQVSPPGREAAGRVDAFLAAFTAECPLAPADAAAVEAFRPLTLATYAKFMAARRAAGRLPTWLHEAHDRTLAALG